MVLAILVLAAAAAANDGDLISGKVIVALFSAIFAAGGGIWIGRKGGESAAERGWAEKEQKLRAEIANELRTKIVNDPLNIEQTPYQASMKANASEHREIFDRLRKCEANVATLMERSISQGKILDRMADQVGQLYDRIVMGKRK